MPRIHTTLPIATILHPAICWASPRACQSYVLLHNELQRLCPARLVRSTLTGIMSQLCEEALLHKFFYFPSSSLSSWHCFWFKVSWQSFNMASGLNIEPPSPEMSQKCDSSSLYIESLTTPNTQYSNTSQPSPKSTRHRAQGSRGSLEPLQDPVAYSPSPDLYDPPFSQQCLLSFGELHY